MRSLSINDSQRLLDCPFCGGQPEYRTTSYIGAPWGHVGLDAMGTTIVCKHCGCTIPSKTATEDAEKAWNTRAERTCWYPATLGRSKAKSHPYGYEPDTGAFDVTRCECGCLNDISATYCNNCGGEIEVDMNAEKEIYHMPQHSVFATKHDDGSLEFGGKRYVAATLGSGTLEEENTKLREELDSWHKLAAGIELPDYPVVQFQPKDLERENAKLRELVRDLYMQLLNAYDHKELDEFDDRMRELGVKVEA